MENPFKYKPLLKENFIQQLFWTKENDNAIIELNNLLASKPIRDITISDVIQIEVAYKVNFKRSLKKNLLEFYNIVLMSYLQDSNLSEIEKSELRGLKLLFNLTDSDVKDIHVEFTSRLFKEKLEKSLSDTIYNDEKHLFFNSLRENLELPVEIAEKISSEYRVGIIQDKMKVITYDNKISPDELQELEALSKSLDVTLDMNDASKEAVEKMKLFWLIENGQIPAIETDLNLSANELCHYKSNAAWYELRKVTKRINYHGPILTIPIYKGIKYKLGSVSPSRVTKDEIQLIDTGVIYITNKRVIFVGNKGNKTILLSKILFIEATENGVVINKETRTSPIVEVAENSDMLTLILNRLVNR